MCCSAADHSAPKAELLEVEEIGTPWSDCDDCVRSCAVSVAC